MRVTTLNALFDTITVYSSLYTCDIYAYPHQKQGHNFVQTFFLDEYACTNAHTRTQAHTTHARNGMAASNNVTTDRL